MKYCPFCGAQLEETVSNAEYCPNCGKRLSSHEYNNNSSVKAEDSSRQSINGIQAVAFIIMIISIFLSIGLAVLSIVYEYNPFYAGYLFTSLIWKIGMTIYYYNNSDTVGNVFKICTFIFVSRLAGIIMFCDKNDKKHNNTNSSFNSNSSVIVNTNNISKTNSKQVTNNNGLIIVRDNKYFIESATSPIIKRAFISLIDGDFDKADETVEQYLNTDPENGIAYIAKLLIEYRASDLNSLYNQKIDFSNSKNYRKAVLFGDNIIKIILDKYNFVTKENNLINRYNQAKELMNKAKNEFDFLNASSAFKELGQYNDSEEFSKICKRRAEQARDMSAYNYAVSLMNNNSGLDLETKLANYNKAKKILLSHPEWVDSDKNIQRCSDSIKAIEKYQYKQELKKALIVFFIMLGVLALLIVLYFVFGGD